jgi:hypothetical protein
MDLEGFFRTRVESLLVTASWVEQVQEMLQLTGVSQVWGERPEWYVWIDGAPGVYSLVFEDGEVIQAVDKTLYLGQFTAKCYPYATAGVFEAFSPQEQEMVKSDLFDHTHTPLLEGRREIPAAFFVVGSISLVLDAAESVALLSFDSLDLLRWSSLSAETDCGNHLPAKSRMRNIPGWQIGYALFDRLVSLYAFYSKQPPNFVAATRSPGFETIIDAHQTPASRACAEIQQRSTSVLFVDSGDPKIWVDAIWRSQLEPEEQIIFEYDWKHSAYSHSIGSELLPVGSNALWWHLAHADLKSKLASTCGCKEHEDHGRNAKFA